MVCTLVSVTNPLCPDHTSHYDNAAERLFPGVERPNAEQDEAILAEAEAEYRACEGH